MDQSPPKRITRARAAAKTTDTGVKIATAATKAKLTRSASTTQRKTRAADTQEITTEEPNVNIIESEPPKTRGRQKKIVAQPEPEPEVEEEVALPVKATRGRQKKLVAEPAIVEAPRTRRVAAAAPPVTSATEAPRTLRGRPKKSEAPQEETGMVAEEPAQKPVRGRAAIISRATGPKKSVKFEEPDKENMLPAAPTAKGKAKVAEAATGLKAKPVRKPAAAAARATRGRPKVEEPKSSPLSPKKATQVATASYHSEDELAATDKTPLKPLQKSPIKAPGSVFGAAKKLDFSTSIAVNRVVTQDHKAPTMASPARRLPQSPFKDSMKVSPQKASFGDTMLRSPFKFPLPTEQSTEVTSTFKTSMLQSPARRPQSPIKLSELSSPTRSRPPTFAVTPKANTFKISRFNTPKTLDTTHFRSMKNLAPNTVLKQASNGLEMHNSTEVDELQEPAMTFTGRLSSIVPRGAESTTPSVEPVIEGTEDEAEVVLAITSESILMGRPFNGQQLDNLPSTSDGSPTPPVPGAFALRTSDESPFDDSESEDELASTSPRYSPGGHIKFNIRGNNLATSPATPTPFTATAKTPRTSATAKSTRIQKLGFTPLAQQLTDWMAASPEKSVDSASDYDELSTGSLSKVKAGTAQASPSKSTFFDDEMSIRDEMHSAEEVEDDVLEAINFAPVELDEEDLDLAHEAEELSVLEPNQVQGFRQGLDFLDGESEEDGQDSGEDDLMDVTIRESDNNERQEIEIESVIVVQSSNLAEQVVETLNVVENKQIVETISAVPDTDHIASHDLLQDVGDYEYERALSETSQEYGDENALPIDPELLALPEPVTPRRYATPKRVLAERVFHTVSKVPLKPAADDTPMRPAQMKRSASISRLPVPRPSRPSSGLTRSNTVISYSPSKKHVEDDENEVVAVQDSPITPSKADNEVWSIAATPARTPRRDLDTALLKGAVVFVDVHTSEGADASLIFTELLTQMGAKCVKSWNWNGSLEDGNKIGITHVVFKDGGKRTLEKSRATGGIVSCVGVGWVLDCERENKWVSESPYSIDTAMVPRGGHRRRKSMEPKALANHNGTLFPSVTPVRNSRKTMSPTKESFNFAVTPFTSKSHRRDSIEWVRSPASSASDDHFLSPVPATPAPEVISAYAEEGIYGEETPGKTPYFLHKEQLVQKTAPPGKRYFDGEGGNGGFLTEKKDESVMMRLMAARRKSLQFAPKVGSPLARAAEW